MLKHFRVNVCVNLRNKKKFHADGILVSGYFQLFFLTSQTAASVPELISEFVTEGEIDWLESKIEEVNFPDIEPTISQRYINGVGVWYSSGRAFFPQE
jgi:hypothetical protein